MPQGPSLIPGRNRRPLSDTQIQRVTITFFGFEREVPTRYSQGEPTVFRVVDDNGEHYGEIRFGDDIYPGDDIITPNSVLSMTAAAAHELAHYFRWRDLQALHEDELEHIDEALTSLQAIQRYERRLEDPDIRALVADAVQRLQLFVRQWREDREPTEGELDDE